MRHALCAVSQAQSGPQLQAEPQAQLLVVLAAWHPQVQPSPGQVWQAQLDSMSFMVVSVLVGCRYGGQSKARHRSRT
jgi:hypothetical protein